MATCSAPQPAVAGGHARVQHPLDATEQLLVLQLLVAEPHQRLERDLVAEPVTAGYLEHLGADEPLDESEDVGVGATLHLAHQPTLAGGKERRSIDQRQSCRQEGLREVEVPAADDIGVDVPPHPLRGLDAARIARVLAGHRGFAEFEIHRGSLHGRAPRGWFAGSRGRFPCVGGHAARRSYLADVRPVGLCIFLHRAGLAIMAAPGRGRLRNGQRRLRARRRRRRVDS